MDCSLPGYSVHGIPQPKILEWVAMPSSQPRDQTCISYVSDTGRKVLTTKATWEVLSSLFLNN